MISFTESIVQERFDESLSRLQNTHGNSSYYLKYRDTIGQEMLAFLHDETLNMSRVAIMFGLHSYLREKLIPQNHVTGNVANDKATTLLQFLVLAISGTIVGVQDFMATSPAPICEILLAAGANPNAPWPGHDGGSLWTHLLFYYATRIKRSRDIPDISTMEAFVKNGADMTTCVDFRGMSFSTSWLAHFLLKNYPKFANELTKLLEIFEANTETLPPTQITISPPVEQACVSQLASLTEGDSLEVSSSSRTSINSSSSAVSQSPSEKERRGGSRRSRLLRKIFKDSS